MKKYCGIGLMSGSSLDGLDVAYCELQVRSEPSFEVLDWQLVVAETIPFSPHWQERLRTLPQKDALFFCQTNTDFGHLMGQITADFIQKNRLSPDFIASHGHTIFHYPDKKFTTQIGCGAAIAAQTACLTICDFRSHDLALGGQGTPLAPTADRYLFGNYDFYLNLGGIANLTCHVTDKNYFIAFDVGAANQVLNSLVQLLGFEYDKNGENASRGQLNTLFFEQINALDYFQQDYPKSLDNNWLRKNITQQYLDFDAPIADKLHTACEQLAYQTHRAIELIIKKECLSKEKYTLLATGGGAMNGFLIKMLQQYCPNVRFVTPERKIIDYKEALLMTLLGVMRLENAPNSMASVTGARKDSVGGAIYSGV